MRLTAELCSGWMLGFSGFTSNTPISPEDGLGPKGVQRSTSDSPLVSCHQSRRPAGSPWGPTWLHWLHSEGREGERTENEEECRLRAEQNWTQNQPGSFCLCYSCLEELVWNFSPDLNPVSRGECRGHHWTRQWWTVANETKHAERHLIWILSFSSVHQ